MLMTMALKMQSKYTVTFVHMCEIECNFSSISEANATNCPDGWMQTSYENNVKNVIWVLAAIGLFIEVSFCEFRLFIVKCDVFQLVQAFFQRYLYISFINLFDWFAYVSAIVLLFDIQECGLRTVSLRFNYYYGFSG